MVAPGGWVTVGFDEAGSEKRCELPAEGHARRKADHVRIALSEDVGFGTLTTGLERYRFVHQALPGIDLAAVDTSTIFLGRPIAAPLVVSCMTGGFAGGGEINRRLAQAAGEAGLPVGVGSQRAALADPALAESYRVRPLVPDVPLLANLGASELLGPGAVARCREAVAMIEADALVVHLNPLQEALQPEGSARFAGLADAIADVAAALEAPVIVKEVGWGIAENVARTLAEAGVAGIDVAGAGGTSWSEVERHRIDDPVMRAAAASFRDWGIPTADAILAARRGFPDGLLIASGGLRTGIDAAKSIALGADAAAFAAPLLRAAADGRASLDAELRRLRTELRLAMFCIGAATVAELRATPHLARVEVAAREGSLISPTIL